LKNKTAKEGERGLMIILNAQCWIKNVFHGSQINGMDI
jgi:hypothetical protein